MFDDQTEPHLVPKLLLKVSLRELTNILVSDSNDGGIKETRDEENIIIIRDSTLRSLLPQKLKQMSSQYKFMCGCECCISDKIIYSSLLSWRDRYLKKLKDQIQHAQNGRCGEKAHHKYKTYKNTVMPHGPHIYANASDTEQDTMCAYPQSDHSLPHSKCVLWCCNYCPYINIPDQEKVNQYSDTTTSVRLYIYHIIASYTVHGRILLK